MVDAVDPLLNDSVDLYVQTVDYRWILTPVGAESKKLCRNPATFGYRCRIPAVLCQTSARLIGIWSEWPRSSQNGMISASWSRFGQDSRLLVNWPGSDRFVPDYGEILMNLKEIVSIFRPLLLKSVCAKYNNKYFYIIFFML
jgi:hypothetical protein